MLFLINANHLCLRLKKLTELLGTTSQNTLTFPNLPDDEWIKPHSKRSS